MIETWDKTHNGKKYIKNRKREVPQILRKVSGVRHVSSGDCLSRMQPVGPLWCEGRQTGDFGMSRVVMRRPNCCHSGVSTRHFKCRHSCHGRTCFICQAVLACFVSASTMETPDFMA